MIVSFSMKVQKPISVSAETLCRFVQSAECLTELILYRVECPELVQDPSQLVKLQQLVDSHQLLQSICIGDISVCGAHLDRLESRLSLKEIMYLVKFTRLLAGYKLSRPLRVPMEIILQIFGLNALETGAVSSLRLNLIMKCLADRCTLGRVRSEVVEVNWAVFYAKCLQALRVLE